MNKNCNNKKCYYYNTCLIDNFNRQVKCSGKLSNNNPHSPSFQAITRGDNEKKG